MFKKVLLWILTLIIIISFPVTLNASKYDDYVILSGESIGLKVKTDIEIVGKYSVETKCGKVNPWENSNIESGDLITEVDNISVKSNDELIKVLKNNKKEVVKLNLIREGASIITTIKIVESLNKEKSIGLYIKDQLMGIGTLSFIDSKNYTYAALGHGIYEKNDLINCNEGYISKAKVVGIKKATVNQTGEKRGIIDKDIIGSINLITNYGIYGKVCKNNMVLKSNNKLEIAKTSELEYGKAQIYTVLNSSKITPYEIEITKLETQSSIKEKGIKFTITDSRLLEEAGGVIQGMSGSPIVQNGKIVGVVSHVATDNPKIGYGMYAYWMYEEMKNIK